MGLPKLDVKKAGTAVKEVAGSRARKLGDSIGAKANPKRLAAAGAEGIKSKLFSEIPELGIFATGISSVFKDLKSGMDDTKKNNSKDKSSHEKVAKETHEQTNKLSMIKMDTGDTVETLSKVLNVLEFSIARQLEGDKERIAELRGLTEKVENGNSTAIAHAAVAADHLKVEKDKIKKDKFAKQKSKAKIVPKKTKPKIAPTKQKSNAFMKFFAGTFLLRMFTGFTSLLKPIFTAIAGLTGLKALKKLLPSFLKPAARGKDGIRMQRRGKGGRFVKDSKITKARKGIVKGAKKAGPSLLKLAKVGKGLARGSGILTLAIILFDALMGGFTEGIKSFKSGNSAPKIAADFLAGAFKGIVMGFVETIKLLVIDLPKFLFAMNKEVWKNMSGFVSENVIQPVGVKIQELFVGIGDRMLSALTQFKDFIISGLKFMTNAYIDNSMFTKYLPESVKNKIKFDTPEAAKALEEKIVPKSKSAPVAAALLTGQRAINAGANPNLNSNHPGAGLAPAAGNQTSIVSAPVSSSIQNNTIIKGNIHTRNPDSPIFPKQKASF